MTKSPDAFRTISEVADELETPAHVLRFWESRFPQIRPVKRAGGRRYYRPADVALLTGIKHLLHNEGMTIRGVQKILREQGVRHVAGLSGAPVPDDIDLDAEAALEAALASNFGLVDADDIEPEQAETATVVALETALRRSDAPLPTTPAEVIAVFPAAAPVATLVAAPVAVAEPVPEAPFHAVEDDGGDAVIDAPAQPALFQPSLFPEIETAKPRRPREPAPMAEPSAAIAVDSPPAAQPAETPSLIARLRALPPLALRPRHAEAAALRDRASALHDRLQAAPGAIAQTH